MGSIFGRPALACIVAGVIVLFGRSAGAAGAPVAIPLVARPPPLDPRVAPASWPSAAVFALPWDVVHTGPAAEATTVRIANDTRFIYVRFDVVQREPVIATQHSNDTVTGGSQSNGTLSWSNDDAVWVDLWPAGTGGFAYQFEANPNGSHNEASSENAAFAPQWESHGATHDDGYTVTMAIPLAVIHGAHGGTWRVQLVRYVRTTAAEDVWSYDRTQSSPDDITRSGSVTFTLGTPPLPKPRAAVYALGTVASAAAGGSTSRVGADLSIPVTPTAAVFAALHPDYSNVELDQQTIAPTVYQRQYAEVRPFFTQAASYYDDYSCNACSVYWTNLYTPAIPTFAQGYAFEGKQGQLGFAAFDAIGSGRDDNAAALDYTSPDTHWLGTFQHVGVDLPGITDESNVAALRWTDRRYLTAYVDAGNETGTDVAAPSQALVFDGAASYVSPHVAAVAALRSIGPDYAPIDGYVTHAGVAGYAVYAARLWDFTPSNVLASLGISGFIVAIRARSTAPRRATIRSSSTP